MNENEKALEAINIRIKKLEAELEGVKSEQRDAASIAGSRQEKLQGLQEQAHEAHKIEFAFELAVITATNQSLEKQIKSLVERIESMESLRKLEWEALQGQNAFNEAKMDALEERIEKLGG